MSSRGELPGQPREAEAIRRLWPDVTVVGSHAITREWREYERTSTTVLSAYVKPVAARSDVASGWRYSTVYSAELSLIYLS